MKKIGLVIIAIMLAVSPVFFTSCGGDKEKEMNPLADSLKEVNNGLSGKLNEKELALQEFISTFNEIQENLNTIKEKEKIVTKNTTGGDVKSKEDQIKEDIQAIYDLMGKNKSRINSLSKKLKDSNLKLEGMETMIVNLQNALNMKDEEITDLKNKMESLNIELSTLNTDYKEIQSESDAKTAVIKTAYYAFGTSKELKEKNIITKEGGFIGIGKTHKVKEDFNKEYFTKVNIDEVSSINIGAKKAKIITTHPSNSYKLIGEKTVEKIEITNAEEFWSVSKYLVIIIE
jgi:predicted  nucleic acid-binding Zn-ribbon protein